MYDTSIFNNISLTTKPVEEFGSASACCICWKLYGDDTSNLGGESENNPCNEVRIYFSTLRH